MTKEHVQQYAEYLKNRMETPANIHIQRMVDEAFAFRFTHLLINSTAFTVASAIFYAFIKSMEFIFNLIMS